MDMVFHTKRFACSYCYCELTSRYSTFVFDINKHAVNLLDNPYAYYLNTNTITKYFLINLCNPAYSAIKEKVTAIYKHPTYNDKNTPKLLTLINIIFIQISFTELWRTRYMCPKL